MKNKYKSATHFVYSCRYHVIFCPKYRKKVLYGAVGWRLKELIQEKQEDYDYEVLDMEVMPDHVHLLLDVNPQVGINNVVRKIKGYTSKKLREEFPHLVYMMPVLWTTSKFISSVGAVSIQVVKKYIMNQKYVN